MKKSRVIAFVLMMTLMFTVTAPMASGNYDSYKVKVLSEVIDTDNSTGKTVVMLGDSVFYVYATPELAYVAQITSDGRIQFSYVKESNRVVESEIYSIDSIYNTFGAIKTSENSLYDIVNGLIINNIESFTKVRYHAITTSTVPNGTVDINGSSTLSAEITDAFGSNYVNTVVGYTTKKHNNNSYTVYCKESQTTSTGSIDSSWFASQTALSAVASWILSGNWTWVGVAATVVTEVVSTVVLNGITYTKNSFTAERVNITRARTRIVTVQGNSNTQYWAGWTQKLRFFKGDLGWTHDYGYYYDVKHTDYDDISGLLDKGFNAYVTNNNL